MSRILSDFEDRYWIVKKDQTYQLTDLGEFVSAQLEKFRTALRFERTLRAIWPWLPHEINGFSVELFTDVVVSQPGPGYPYQPVERLTHLITETTTISGFGMAMLKSGNLEVFFDRTLEDLECEYIYPPPVFVELLSWDEQTVLEAVTRVNYTVLLHDELPLDERCGICIFDDRVGICCYDLETGTLQSFVDTGSPEMRTWAESYYKRFREEAQSLNGADDFVSIESLP